MFGALRPACWNSELPEDRFYNAVAIDTYFIIHRNIVSAIFPEQMHVVRVNDIVFTILAKQRAFIDLLLEPT